MRKLFVAILLILPAFAFCQSEIEIGDKPLNYTTNNLPLPMFECNMIGRVLDTTLYAAKFNASFYLVGYKGNDSAIITFWFFTGDNTDYFRFNVPANPIGKAKIFADSINAKNGKNSERKILSADERKYFLISKYHLKSNCTPRYSISWKRAQVVFSAVTMPIKLRLKDFDFDKSFSLGVAGGVRKRISRYKDSYLNILGSLNISTTDLDSFSTKGMVISQPIKNIATFSPAVGTVFEFGKAQFGIFCGIDLMSKANRQKFDWIYHGKTWISIGLGFSILSKENEKGSGKSKEGENDGKGSD